MHTFLNHNVKSMERGWMDSLVIPSDRDHFSTRKGERWGHVPPRSRKLVYTGSFLLVLRPPHIPGLKDILSPGPCSAFSSSYNMMGPAFPRPASCPHVSSLARLSPSLQGLPLLLGLLFTFRPALTFLQPHLFWPRHPPYFTSYLRLYP